MILFKKLWKSINKEVEKLEQQATVLSSRILPSAEAAARVKQTVMTQSSEEPEMQQPLLLHHELVTPRFYSALTLRIRESSAHNTQRLHCGDFFEASRLPAEADFAFAGVRLSSSVAKWLFRATNHAQLQLSRLLSYQHAFDRRPEESQSTASDILM
jgi:hypothetical protein